MKIKTWIKKLQRQFDILTGDLSIAEMETLIKRDVPGMFEFYSQQYYVDKKRNILVRWFYLIANMFMAFGAKLKPARRLVYVIAFVLFIRGFTSFSKIDLVAGFALVSILLAFELADKLMAKDELEIARNIQMQLLPEKAPQHPHYEITFFAETAREVGGDFFDFIHNDDKLNIVVGDISGKGMGAAIHMVQLHTLIKNLQNEKDAKILLHKLNKSVSGILPKSVFLTTSILCLNKDNTAELYRSGHLPMIKYSAKDKTCKALAPPGMGIGIAEQKVYENTLQGQEVVLGPGDVAVLYTDGLVETMNKDFSEFGEDRLLRIVCDNAEKSINEIKDAILTAAATFRGKALQHDDLTLIVIKGK